MNLKTRLLKIESKRYNDTKDIVIFNNIVHFQNKSYQEQEFFKLFPQYKDIEYKEIIWI